MQPYKLVSSEQMHDKAPSAETSDEGCFLLRVCKPVTYMVIIMFNIIKSGDTWKMRCN
jgi:hypothetical protein